MEQLRESSDRVQSIVEEAAKDVERMTESSRNIKRHVYNLFDVLQDSYGEIKVVKKKLESSSMHQESLPLGNERNPYKANE